MKINYDDCIKVNYVKEKLKLKRMIPKTYEILKKYNCYIAGGANIFELISEECFYDDLWLERKEKESDKD